MLVTEVSRHGDGVPVPGDVLVLSVTDGHGSHRSRIVHRSGDFGPAPYGLSLAEGLDVAAVWQG